MLSRLNSTYVCDKIIDIKQIYEKAETISNQLHFTQTFTAQYIYRLYSQIFFINFLETLTLQIEVSETDSEFFNQTKMHDFINRAFSIYKHKLNSSVTKYHRKLYPHISNTK